MRKKGGADTYPSLREKGRRKRSYPYAGDLIRPDGDIGGASAPTLHPRHSRPYEKGAWRHCRACLEGKHKTPIGIKNYILSIPNGE